mmetsp:Transcript_23372/g.60997  ORF Transcript_23372/g.60997 Transcript_23372/m.60997 type:complete len:259 (+) Transcript_23372:72-848(+)
MQASLKAPGQPPGTAPARRDALMPGAGVFLPREAAPSRASGAAARRRADGVLLHRPPPPPREGGRGCRGGHTRLVPGSSQSEGSANSGGVPSPGDADAAPCACCRTPLAAGGRAPPPLGGRAARRRLGRGPAAARGRRAGRWTSTAVDHAGRAADRRPRCRGRLCGDAAAAAHAHAVGRREWAGAVRKAAALPRPLDACARRRPRADAGDAPAAAPRHRAEGAARERRRVRGVAEAALREPAATAVEDAAAAQSVDIT